MIVLHYYYISPNMACFCKLMAQNWHKSFSSFVREVVFIAVSYSCEELVGVTHRSWISGEET